MLPGSPDDDTCFACSSSQFIEEAYLDVPSPAEGNGILKSPAVSRLHMREG